MRGGRHRVHRAQGRLRRHLGAHRTRPTTVECLSFADLYALIGPESEGFDNWTDAPGAGHRAGLDHRVPRRRPRHHRPRRGVRHLRQLHRDRLRRHRRGAARGRRRSPRTRPRPPGPTTSRRPTTTSSSRASRAEDGSLGWVGFAFAEEAGDQVKEIADRRRARRRLRRADRRDHRRRQRTRSPGRSTST